MIYDTESHSVQHFRSDLAKQQRGALDVGPVLVTEGAGAFSFHPVPFSVVG